MKKILVLLISIIGWVALVWCGTQTPTWTSTPTKTTSSKWYTKDQLDSFATCLTEKWMKMYGTNWCSHCQRTKANFKDSFDKVTFINCDPKNTQLAKDMNVQCATAGIEWYPTRIYNGQKYAGYMNLEQIAEISSCSLTGENPVEQPVVDAQTELIPEGTGVVVEATGAEIILSWDAE